MESFIFLIFFFCVFVFIVVAVFSFGDDSSPKKAMAQNDEAHFIRMRTDEKIHVSEKTAGLVKSITNIFVLTFTDLELNTKIKIHDEEFFVSKEIEIKNMSDFVRLSTLLRDLSENKRQKVLFDQYGI